MALTATIHPYNYQLSKNPVILRLSTNSYTLDAGAKFSFYLQNSGVNAVGGTFTFSWAYGAVVFTIATTPDNTGYQIRPKGGNTDTDYSTMVAADMAKNKVFSDAYQIIAFGPWLLILARENGVGYDLSANFAQVNTGYVAGTPSPGADVVYNENYKMIAECWLESLFGSTLYYKIGSIALDPLDDQGVFDFKTMLNANLVYQIPDFSPTAPVAVNGHNRRFYARYYEQGGTPVVAGSVTTTTPGYILKAGVTSDEFYGSSKLMESKFMTPGKFMTNQPRTKKVTKTQMEYLYFVSPAVYTGWLRQRITISLKSYKADIVIDGVYRAAQEYKVWLYTAGFDQLNLSAHADFADVKSYTVKIFHDATGDIVSETFTYIPDEDVYIDDTYFLFTTSCSGVDTAHFTGVKETGFDIEKETIQVSKVWNAAPTIGEYKDVNHMVKNNFSVSSGWITKEEADWLQDLFIAEQKFIIASDRFIPIIINTVTAGKYNSQTGKTFYQIEYSFADTNPVINSLL
jgi:hypothetical protein